MSEHTVTKQRWFEANDNGKERLFDGLLTINADLLAALKAGNELWGWLPFDSGEDIQQAARKVRDIQHAAIAKAKG